MEQFQENADQEALASAQQSYVWRFMRAERQSTVIWTVMSLTYMTMLCGCSPMLPDLMPWQLWLNWALAGTLGSWLHYKRKPQCCNEQLLSGAVGIIAVMLPIAQLTIRKLQLCALLLGFSQSLALPFLTNRSFSKTLSYLGVDLTEGTRSSRRIPGKWLLMDCCILLLSLWVALRKTFSLAYAMLVLIAAVCLMICGLNNPFDARLMHKLELYLRQTEDGISNPALKHWIDARIIHHERRPWFILLLVHTFRVGFHHRTVFAQPPVHDDENPAVYLCNHATVYGPVTAKLFTPYFVRPWVISYIMDDMDETVAYLYKYTFSQQKWLPRPFQMPLAKLASRLSHWAMRALESVPVFRDHPAKLMKTFRAAVDVMKCGDDMLIFPENPNAVQQDHGYEANGVGELFSGFAMLAPIYYSRTGKRCRFIPMYAHKKSRTVAFGPEVVFDPDNDPTDERERLVHTISNEMNRLANELETRWQQKKHQK